MKVSCIGKAPLSTVLAGLLLGVCFSHDVCSQTLAVEDWDSTPEITDQVRGWGSVQGAAELESGLGTGNFARAERIASIPNFLSVPAGSDPALWFSNDFVGDRDYSGLGVDRVSFLARHDEVEFAIQVSAVPTSLLMVSGDPVPDPEDPTNMVLPFVWTISENQMILDGGWTLFEFEIPSSSPTLPQGWLAFPDDPSTWNSVIADVDQISVVFAPFDIGIGGIPAVWENAIDNFVVEAGGVESVPSMSIFGLVLLIAGILLIGVLVSIRSTKLI